MTPRWILAIAGVLTVLAAAVILYWAGRREGAAREQPKIEAARATAAVSGLETKGARESARRVEVAVRQRESAVRTVADVTAKALQSEDANAPLEPERADRLRAADRELCGAAPELSGCAKDRDPG